MPFFGVAEAHGIADSPTSSIGNNELSGTDRGVLYALWNLDCGQVAAVLLRGRNSSYPTFIDEILTGTMSC